MKPQTMFAVAQGDAVLSVCYAAKECRREVGFRYAKIDESWQDGWERAKKADCRVVRVTISPAKEQP